MLQIIAVIPVIGGLVFLVATQLGAGALLYRTWRLRHTGTGAPVAAAQPA